MSESTCQHCDREVLWLHNPVDATYPAFVHAETGTVACPESESES